MNTRKLQAESTKKALVDAAYKIIKESGFQEISANKIVEVSGLSKGSVFHHFPQIEDLYLHILDKTIEKYNEELEPGRFSSFERYISFTSDYLLDSLDEHPESTIALFYFFSRCQHNPEYQARLQKMMEDSFEVWSGKLASFFGHTLSKSEKDFLIRTMDIYFGGLSTHYLIFKDKKRYKKLTREFASLIADYVRGKQDAR